MSNKEQSLIAYADCFSGISGDMFLGALVDAGLESAVLQEELAKVDVGKFDLHHYRTHDQGISATRLEIKGGGKAGGRQRPWKAIRALIEHSGLQETVKEKSSYITSY